MVLPQNYLTLPQSLYQLNSPTAVSNPELLYINTRLINELGLEDDFLSDSQQSLDILSGNSSDLVESALSTGYAGHQFGNFVPQLGDGRAHLLGQLTGSNNVFDVMLKGSGTNRYSRSGDGRCGLKAALRELLVSEILSVNHAPTTRMLSIVSSSDTIMRQTIEQSAIVSRLAKSHIRIGTFQYAALHQDKSVLPALLEFTLANIYPKAMNAENPALALFKLVLDNCVDLVCHWLRIGFVHGVMNTDNILLSGETIDFGPCAFINSYDPDACFSSIDHQKRYAYKNQPSIMHWNLARFAECLIPLVDKDEQTAITKLSNALATFGDKFKNRYATVKANKLGFNESSEIISNLYDKIVETSQRNKINFFDIFKQLELQDTNQDTEQHFKDFEALKQEADFDLTRMTNSNPRIILNQDIETVLDESVAQHSIKPIENYLAYLNGSNNEQYGDITQKPVKDYQTFCGT